MYETQGPVTVHHPRSSPFFISVVCEGRNYTQLVSMTDFITQQHLLSNKHNHITWLLGAGPAGITLPGGVAPADRDSGADMFPVEQKPDCYRATDQRQEPDVSFGGQDSGEAAGHVCFL